MSDVVKNPVEKRIMRTILFFSLLGAGVTIYTIIFFFELSRDGIIYDNLIELAVVAVISFGLLALAVSEAAWFKKRRMILEKGKDGEGKYLDHKWSRGRGDKTRYFIKYSFTDEYEEYREVIARNRYTEAEVLAIMQKGVFPIKFIGKDSIVIGDE